MPIHIFWPKMMSSVLILLFYQGLLLPTNTDCQASSWKGLKPLRSSRNEVEKLIGSPNSECTFLCLYELAEENIVIQYSEGGCHGKDSECWNVPPNTILSISIYLKVPKKITDLKIDLSHFHRTEDSELEEVYTYVMPSKGVSFVAHRDIVSAFYFEPTKEDNKFRCSLPISSTPNKR